MPNTLSPPRAHNAIPLWRQLQQTASVLLAVQAGESGTVALSRVEPSLRPGVQSLSFHAWRWLGTAQILRSMLAKRPPPPQVEALLCVALSLLCFDDPVFESSADMHYDAFTLVDQTVEAAKRNPAIKANSSFINACLRRFLREKKALMSAVVANPVGRWNHPLWWINRVKKDHPQQWQSILQANNAKAPLTLRINAQKTSVALYLQALSATKTGAIRAGEYGITLQNPTPVAQMLGFAEGQVSVQDAAAQLAAPLLMQGLENRADIHVLDACAAPGGKTAHLLEIAKCQVTAMDIDAERCEKIHETLQRLGLKASIRVADAARLETWASGENAGLTSAPLSSPLTARFDAILLDAPCTASGIVRRHPDIRWLRRESDVEQLARTQLQLLATLWPLVNPGGRLLYCTCSVFKAEGDNQVHAFLASNKNATLLPSPGHLIANNAANHAAVDDNVLTNHDGFFYALFEKSSS